MNEVSLVLDLEGLLELAEENHVRLREPYFRGLRDEVTIDGGVIDARGA